MQAIEAIEIHVQTRAQLLPDPCVDAIGAICYVIRHETLRSNEAETKAPTTAFSTTGSGNIELADSQAVDPNEEPTQLPKPSGDESLSA